MCVSSYFTVLLSFRSFSITSIRCSFWSGSRLETRAETSVKHPHWWAFSEDSCMMCRLPVEFLNGVSGSFPDVRWKVGGWFFDGQHHDGDDDGNSDTGQDPESACSDQLIWILHTHTHTNDENVLNSCWSKIQVKLLFYAKRGRTYWEETMATRHGGKTSILLLYIINMGIIIIITIIIFITKNI